MIRIKKNQLMHNVINEIDTKEHHLSGNVLNLTNKKLEVTNDYVVLAKPVGYKKEIINSWKGDMTGFEGNHNDFHISQNLNSNILEIKERIKHGVLHGLFQKSIVACEEIFNLLKTNNNVHDNDNFIISFSIDSYDPEIDGDRDEITDWHSSVRFTRKRKKTDSWLSSDLEVYNQPAMTIDFNKKSIERVPINWWI